MTVVASDSSEALLMHPCCEGEFKYDVEEGKYLNEKGEEITSWSKASWVEHPNLLTLTVKMIDLSSSKVISTDYEADKGL